MQEKRLEIFLAVAMSRTLGKAADLISITPSTVSRELKELEKEMGMILVDRQKGVKFIRLTPAGEALLPLVLKWQEIRREISSARTEQSVFSLCVAGCEVANNNLLPDFFNDLLTHTPPVYLRILTDPTDMLYEKVESREADVAFAVHQEPSKFVNITPIHTDEMLVVRLEEERRPSEGVLSPDDLNPGDELYIEWSMDFRLWHNRLWDPNISIPIELLTSYLAPNLMIRAGQWAIVPRCAKPHFTGRGKNLNFYRMSKPIPPLTFYKLTHRNPKLSAAKGLAILDKILARRKAGNKEHDDL